MAKNKNDYFKLAQEQADFTVKAANLLKDIVCDFDNIEIAKKREEMHELEHEADRFQHNTLTKLSREFITPIDQEDILQLIQTIDDVSDAIDEVGLQLYMFNITSMPKYAPEMADLVLKCVNAMYEALKELKNFKKPEKLRDLIVNINSMEGQADTVYVEAIHNLFVSEDVSYKKLLANRAIYERLEDCCDCCEECANIMELIIIKNT